MVYCFILNLKLTVENFRYTLVWLRLLIQVRDIFLLFIIFHLVTFLHKKFHSIIVDQNKISECIILVVLFLVVNLKKILRIFLQTEILFIYYITLHTLPVLLHTCRVFLMTPGMYFAFPSKTELYDIQTDKHIAFWYLKYFYVQWYFLFSV